MEEKCFKTMGLGSDLWNKLAKTGLAIQINRCLGQIADLNGVFDYLKHLIELYNLST
jgi:hypothetical protein